MDFQYLLSGTIKKGNKTDLVSYGRKADPQLSGTYMDLSSLVCLSPRKSDTYISVSKQHRKEKSKLQCQLLKRFFSMENNKLVFTFS